MGTWGVGPFDNDDDDCLLHEALDEVADAGADEYIEAPWAAMAIAAAEIVAAGSGKADPGLPEVAADWVRRTDGLLSDAHRLLALRAVENALSSELAVLWQDSADGAYWRARTDELRERLT